MTNTNKRILVIGATGMLGKPVARQFKADGFKVRLLVSTPEKAKSMLGDGYEIVKGDFEYAAALKSALGGPSLTEGAIL